jgi:hypothetical protein
MQHEAESPWHTGRVAINLVIEQVAQTDASATKGYRYDYPVEHPYIILLDNPRKDEQSQQDAKGSAMAGEASLPDIKDLKQMMGKVIPLIKEAMADTRPHYGEAHHKEEQLIHGPLGHILPLVDAFLHGITNQKAESPHQAIPTNRKDSQVEQLRIDRPGDE